MGVRPIADPSCAAHVARVRLQYKNGERHVPAARLAGCGTKGGPVRVRLSLLCRQPIAPLLAMAAALLLLGGCGATSAHSNWEKDWAPQKGYRVRVADIVDQAPVEKRKSVKEFDVVGELRTRLSASIDKKGLGVPPQSASPQLSLTTRILDYDPGNAFGRWLSPGLGSTVLSVECKVFDGPREVGTVWSLRTVSYGGAYSIGQWKEIFKTVADDVAGELKKKIG